MKKAIFAMLLVGASISASAAVESCRKTRTCWEVLGVEVICLTQSDCNTDSR